MTLAEVSGVEKKVSNEAGRLYVVATPIGNLGDLSPRAAEILRAVGLIAAEDTRHTRRLLDHAGIRTPMLSLHEHNERERSAEIVGRMVAGESVALVSDAGTPLISDPGFRLVRAARAAAIDVRSAPGPCAAIAALSIAGLPTDRFVFEGFLENRAAARRTQLIALKNETRTMIFYVSPRRLQDELAAVSEEFGDERQAVLARELTKAFESSYDGTLSDLLQRCQVDASMQKGEMVLLVAGATTVNDSAQSDELLTTLLAELPLKTAVDITARFSNQPRNRLYKRALTLQSNNSTNQPED